VTRVDLVAVCAAFCESVRTILPAAIRLETEFPQDPVHVRLARRGLEDALFNLVMNARHAIQGSGRLTVSVRRRGRRAQVLVADTGVGIAARDLPRVFDAYFTTKPSGEGTGLGLAAVKGYVKASSGAVAVESEVGRGTTFRLEFPLADRATG
jgi:two-component system NtrC family sensor kinase